MGSFARPTAGGGGGRDSEIAVVIDRQSGVPQDAPAENLQPSVYSLPPPEAFRLLKPSASYSLPPSAFRLLKPIHPLPREVGDRWRYPWSGHDRRQRRLGCAMGWQVGVGIRWLDLRLVVPMRGADRVCRWV